MKRLLKKIDVWTNQYPQTLYWGPVVFICILIFWLSNQSKLPDVPVRIPHLDKVEHFLTYSLLGFFVRRAFTHRTPHWNSIFSAIVFCLLFGISDEFHQVFVPNRQADIFDLFADILGGIHGQWWYAQWVEYAKKWSWYE